jgi:hypothetical protein
MNGALPQSFMTQLLVHAVLIFLLGLGLFFSVTAADKAEQVYEEQLAQRATLTRAKSIGSIISEKARGSGLPPKDIDRVNEMIAGLRFISPGNTPETLNLEFLLLAELERLETLLSLPEPDPDKVNETLMNAESLYRQRKQVYAY